MKIMNLNCYSCGAQNTVVLDMEASAEKIAEVGIATEELLRISLKMLDQFVEYSEWRKEYLKNAEKI